MGFGTIAANIIMFIAVLMIASGLIIRMNSYTQETSVTLNTQKNKMLDELRSDITITSSSYSNITDPGKVTIYVKNSGKLDQSINYTEIYVAGERVPNSDKTMTIEPDTMISGGYFWAPSEILKIEAVKNLTPGNYKIKIVSDKGASDETLLAIT